MRGVQAVETFWRRVWQELDPEAVDALVVEDFVLVSGGEVIRSREAFKAWVTGFQHSIDDLRFVPTETFQNSEGTRVAALWELTGRNRGFLDAAPQGAELHLIGTAVWDVREDGMLLRNRVERNALEAVRRLTQQGSSDGSLSGHPGT